MHYHKDLSEEELKQLIDSRQVKLTGHKRLKIFCLLTCRSGKRMLIENRLFFKDEQEARADGFRPCGHCMPVAYRAWKYGRQARQT